MRHPEAFSLSRANGKGEIVKREASKTEISKLLIYTGRERARAAAREGPFGFGGSSVVVRSQFGHLCFIGLPARLPRMTRRAERLNE